MSSKKKIEVYLDCNSPYSYFTFIFLRRNKAILAAHGVSVDINPIFLGGINAGSGNKPPWTLPAKARYSPLDGARAAAYFGVEPMTPPPFFPILSLLPMRSMLYIKHNFPEPLYLDIFEGLWLALWREHKDISKPDVFGQSLGRWLAEEDVQKVLAAATQPEWKGLLTEQTKKLVEEEGAFGAPWFLVTDGEGKREPFFGSDRFPYMMQYLGVPFPKMEILPPQKAKI